MVGIPNKILLMFQHLMRAGKLTDEKLQELRKKVDEKRKEKT